MRESENKEHIMITLHLTRDELDHLLWLVRLDDSHTSYRINNAYRQRSDRLKDLLMKMKEMGEA